MIYWEWRRVIRQKIRSFTPQYTISYQQWSRQRLIISFTLFFVGWKVFGVTLNDMLLWTVDEKTGEGRFLTPAEGKKRREDAEKARDTRLIPSSTRTFDLDD